MSVLYRKYRPQTFAEVVGQPHVTRTLVAALASQRVAHAYLFSGPRGVGKTTAARLLAKAVNCASRRVSDGEAHPERPRAKRGGVEGSPPAKQAATSNLPCNACGLCAEITEGRCLDVIEIDAASHTGVDHVREHIVETVRFAPARAARRVFIIDEVHMLSAASFNALLKTLEEPPGHTLFILATTEFHRVPETIRSRCQHFAFRRVALTDLTQRLRDLASAEGVTVDADVVEAVARAADGSVRDAESVLGQLLAFGGKHIASADAAFVLPRSSMERARALINAIARGDLRAALDEVHTAEEGGFDADAYLRDLIAVLRDAILTALPGGGPASDTIARHIAALQAFSDLLDRMSRSDRPFFSLEVAVLGLMVESGITNQSASGPSLVLKGGAGGGANPPPRSEGEREGVGSRTVEPRGGHRTVRTAIAAAAPSQAQAHGVQAIDADAALTRVREVWPSLPAKLTAANHSLPYLLEGGRPQRVANGVLTIGFRYKLHAEKVRQPAASDAVASALSSLLGSPLRIATAVVSAEEFAALDAAVHPKTGDAVADAALEVFGGRVVE